VNPSTPGKSSTLLFLFAAVALALPAQAAKSTFQRTKPHCNVGTIGHADHGTSTVVAAIAEVTGWKLQSSSTRPWENQVCAGEAAVHFNPYEYTLTKDNSFVPGARQNLFFAPSDPTLFMLTGTSPPNGAAQMDGAILVVSAADGPMPQTREHVLLARQVGVPAPVVYVNEIGVVPTEDVERTKSLVVDLLVHEGYSPDDIRVVSGDAGAVFSGDPEAIESIEQLVAAVIETVPLPDKPADKPFLMPIEDVFTITGRGTAVTGTIDQGIVNVGDVLDLVGGEATNRPAVVAEILFPDRMLFAEVDEAKAGDTVQILLEVDRSAVGDAGVVSEPGSVAAVDSAEMTVYVLKQEEGGRAVPIDYNYRPQFYFRTTDVTGTVSEVENGLLLPGEVGSVLVEFDHYIPDAPGWSIPACAPDTGETSAVGLIVN